MVPGALKLDKSRVVPPHWPSCPIFLAYLLPRGSESRAVGPVGKMNKETIA